MGRHAAARRYSPECADEFLPVFRKHEVGEKLGCIRMRGFRANSQRLKFGKYWVLCDPLYGTAFALNVLNVVQISIEHEGKLAGGQKTGENGQPRVKAKLLSAKLSHVSQSFFLTHSLKLPCKPLRLGVIHPHFSLLLGVQPILVLL